MIRFTKAMLAAGLILMSACATAAARGGYSTQSTRWEGYLLRNGLRSPIAVSLGGPGEGQLSTGDNAVALERVEVTATRVHFELPGEGAFDGAVAGDSIAGSISGPAGGSFVLSRHISADGPYFLGP